VNSVSLAPNGYTEEERTHFPLLMWSATHLWRALRLVACVDPECSHHLSLFALANWPRIKYHVLVEL